MFSNFSKSPVGSFFSHEIKLSGQSAQRAYVKTIRNAQNERVRVLEVGGVYQSATYLDERWADPVFTYYLGFDATFEIVPGAQRLLMIGGGGYAWPKHVLATRGPEVALDVVELEPAITQAAKDWFFLDRVLEEHPGQLNLIEGDGRAFLEEHAAALLGTAPVPNALSIPDTEDVAKPEPYDALVLDAFAGLEPVYALATVEAFRAAKGCLTPAGAVLINVVSDEAGSDLSFLRDMVATAREVFANVQVALCEEDPFAVEDNYLVAATDASSALSGAIPYDDDFLGTVMHD